LNRPGESGDSEYVNWFNHRPLYEACGDIPPAELEAAHYRQNAAPSSSVMAGPDGASSRLASVIGLRSTRTSSWLTETVWVTFSVATFLGSRARPARAPRLRRE
jgi:hypothetical protein